MSDSTFRVNRGSDLTFSYNHPDGAGGNADLTGWTVSIFEPSSFIADAITATLEDPASGLIQIRVDWELITNTKVEAHSFRVLIDNGAGEQQSTNKLTVVYQ